MSYTIDTEHHRDFLRIAEAISYLESHYRQHPSLDETAAHIGLSRYHFTRIFKKWAGITPMQFSQYLTVEYSKEQLQRSRSLLDTSYDAGLSGPGRLHDMFIVFEAMTPGEYKRLAEGLEIFYGFHQSPFGTCLVAITDRGICHLAFADEENHAPLTDELYRRWPCAIFINAPMRTAKIADKIFANTSPTDEPFHLLLKGSNFQVNVWKGLLNIPPGQRICYQDFAAFMGIPQAHRAVASAIAANPLGYLIPCHRVIAKSGKISGYRWGKSRKSAILGWEAVKKTETTTA